MTNELKLYLLASEMLPIIDNLNVEGIKLKRSVEFLHKYLEDFTTSANNAFESNNETRKHHENLILNFSRLMDSLKVEDLTI